MANRYENRKCKWCNQEVKDPEITGLQLAGYWAHSSCENASGGLTNQSSSWQEDVTKFHAKFGLPISTIPRALSAERTNLRLILIAEEVGETMDAIRANDLVEIADGICDSIYVLLGTAIELGIKIAPIWDEVQRTNMAKEGGAIREDGKILKPEGWLPPRVQELLAEQGMKI